MEPEEAKVIVARMEARAKKTFAGPPAYEPAYMVGGLLEQIRWLLMTSNLKFKDFNMDGSYKLPSEKMK